MSKASKNYRKATERIGKDKRYTLDEALSLLKEISFVKFDETVEAVFNLGVNPKHADQMVRGSVVLPKGTGKEVKVLTIASGEKVKEAEVAGSDYSGGKELLEKVKGGWLDFDAVVATPDMMGELGKLGKVLGPRGLMPSPKTGTVTFNIGEAIKDIKAGKVEYRVDKEGNLHAPLGKISFPPEDLLENAKALVGAVVKDKPVAAKGVYIKSLYLTSTMGPSIKIETYGLDKL